MFERVQSAELFDVLKSLILKLDDILRENVIVYSSIYFIKTSQAITLWLIKTIADVNTDRRVKYVGGVKMRKSLDFLVL